MFLMVRLIGDFMFRIEIQKKFEMNLESMWNMNEL